MIRVACAYIGSNQRLALVTMREILLQRCQAFIGK